MARWHRPTTVVQHKGVATHHDGPHPHSIVATPDSRYLLAPDCGLDRIFIYRLDAERGTLIENDPPWVMLAPGAGPRHLAFHPSGSTLFCINERNSTLTALAYEPDGAVLRELQTVSTLPDGFAGQNSCADIHIHPSGRFLYGSNRGHDSIAIFAVDAATMHLRSLGHVATAGRTPRNFGDRRDWHVSAGRQSGYRYRRYLSDRPGHRRADCHRADRQRAIAGVCSYCRAAGVGLRSGGGSGAVQPPPNKYLLCCPASAHALAVAAQKEMILEGPRPSKTCQLSS